MKTIAGVLCLLCVSLASVCSIHADDAGAIAGVIESLRADAASVESTIKDMEGRLAAGRAIQSEIDEENRGTRGADKKAHGDAKAVAAAAGDLAKMEKTLASLKEKAIELQKQVAAVESLRADLVKASMHRQQVEAKAETEAAARQKAEEDLAVVKAKIAAVEKQIAEMRSIVRSGRRLESELADAIEGRKDAFARAEETAADAKAVANSIATAKLTLSEVEKQFAEMKKQADVIAAQRVQLEKEQQLIREHQASAKRSRSEISSLERELSDQLRKKANVDKELAGLRESLKKQADDPVLVELEKTRALRVEAEKLSTGFADARGQAARELEELKQGLEQAHSRAAEMEGQLKAGRRVVSDLAREKRDRESALARAEKEAGAVDELEREMLRIKTEIAKFDAQVADGVKQMEKLGSLQKELDEERKLKDVSEARVKSALTARSALDKDLSRLKAQHDSAKKECERLEARSRMLDQLRAELKDIKGINSGFDARVSELDTARAEAANELAELQAELSLLQKKNDDMNKAIRDARGLESEIAREKKLNAAAEARLERDRKALAAVEKEIAETETRLQAAVGESSAGAAKLEIATRLRSELEKQKKARNDSELAIRDLRSAVEQKKRGISALSKELAAAEKDASRIDDEIVALESSLAAEKKNTEDFEARIAEGRAAIDAAGKDASALEKKIEELRAAYAEKSGKLDEAPALREEIKKEKRLASDAEKKLFEVQSERKGIEKRFVALNKDLSSVETMLARVERSLGGAVQLEADLEKAKRAREEAETFVNDRQQAQDAVSSALSALENKVRILSETAGQMSEKQKNLSSAALPGQADMPKDAGTGDKEDKAGILAEEERILASASSVSVNAVGRANASYQRGIVKWDDGDIDGAIADFNETIKLNPDAAGAYYNLGLAYLQKGDSSRACDYAYKAGQCYLKHANEKQAMRMVLFMKQADSSSPLIEKLRKSIP